MLSILYALWLNLKIKLDIAVSSYVFKLVFTICIAVIILLIFLLWKTYQEKKKVKQLLVERIDYQDKLCRLQNSVSNELLDHFGNKLAAMVNIYEIIKDINETKQQNINDLEKFWNHFEENYSALLSGFDDMMWANSLDNRTLKRTIERIETFIKTLPPYVTITLQSRYVQDFKTPRYWNRQFFLLIKEIIIMSIRFSASRNFNLNILGGNNGKVQVFFNEYTNTFCFKGNPLSAEFENMKRLADSIDSQLEFCSTPSQNYLIITTKIPLINSYSD